MADPAQDILDEITTKQSAEPPELPRLIVANTFTYYSRLISALDNAMGAARKIPDAGATTGDQLKEVIRHCEGAIKSAARLLEANK